MEDKDMEEIEAAVLNIWKEYYLLGKLHFAGKIAEYIIKNFDKKPWLNIPG